MIKSYKLFLESKDDFKINETIPAWTEQIPAICDKYGIKNWFIDYSNGLVDVNGNVGLDDWGLTELPFKFGKVSGYFSCSGNKLTSLEGFPKEINGDLICQYNNITSLEGFPKVGHNIYFSNNKLTSLKGCPKKVNGHFSCSKNLLTNLEGCPQEIRGDFWANKNELTSLEGFISARNINVSNNPISRLSDIGRTMIERKITFLESVMINISLISNKELGLIFQDISAQKILDLNDFKIFNLLRTHLPKKYAEICVLRDVDLSADLGELGF